jgi:hypothetical protein
LSDLFPTVSSSMPRRIKREKTFFSNKIYSNLEPRSYKESSCFIVLLHFRKLLVSYSDLGTSSV